MSESNTNTITIRKDALWKYSTFALLGLLVLGAIIFMLPGKSTNEAVIKNPGANLPPPAPSQVQVSADDDPVLGDADAPVTIIEFSDYQCPFCRKFWTETLPSIKSEYIDTGKVKFVYRDFPLISIHPAAEPAAEVANCVREQGGDEAYWEMHNKIFQEGNILDGGDPINGPVSGTAQFGTTELKKWAQEIGYNVAECLDSGKFRSEVQKDLADGQAAGVRGTPGFVVLKGDNGKGTPVSGAQPFSVFQQVIEAQLNS